jgi:hypothetical protein
MTMVKIFFLVVAVQNWECMQYDFETAFLNGNLMDRLVFMRQPPGFGDGTKRVLKLFKTLYGLRDSSLVWFREVTGLMDACGFVPLATDSCVFRSKDNKVWILVYIDDMAIAAATKEQIEAVAKQFEKYFVLKRLRDVETFLGLRVVRDRDRHTITISQWPYIERILAKKG